jgi:hypothetical protein
MGAARRRTSTAHWSRPLEFALCSQPGIEYLYCHEFSVQTIAAAGLQEFRMLNELKQQ